MSKTFSVAEVAEHKDAEKGLYIIVDENVYDVTGMFCFPSRGPWFSLSSIDNSHISRHSMSAPSRLSKEGAIAD